jgi:ferredoxin, 2Fe-2S
MPKITFLPDNVTTEVPEGTTLLEAAQKAGVKMGSACGGVCACSTCHVWVQQGLASLSEQSEKELDILDKAFDVKPQSRLGCQSEVSGQDVLVQITQESRRTYFDEHPDERAALAATSPAAHGGTP